MSNQPAEKPVIILHITIIKWNHRFYTLQFLMAFTRINTWKMHLNNGGRSFFNVTDPVRIYKFNYWIYVFTGFWKYESASQWKENLFKFYQTVIAMVYFVMVSLFLIDAFSVRHDLDKLSFNMTSSVLICVTVIKVSMIRSQYDKMESVLNSLENDIKLETVGKSKEDKEIFKKRAQLILSLTRLLYALLVVCYCLRVMADTKLDTRAYLIPIPYKEKLEIHYEIIYTQQLVVVTHFVVTVIAHDLLIYGIVNRLLAHFEVLEKNFLRIKSLHPRMNFEKYVAGYRELRSAIKDVLLPRSSLHEITDVYRSRKYGKMSEAEWLKLNEARSKQLLTESIRHHQKLLKETTDFCEIYSQPLVIQVFGTIILLGIVAVKILFLSNRITPLLIQQVVYVGITLVNVLYLCTFGSELSSKSVAAANALYDTPWYEMDVKNRKILIFALKNLMKGPQLRAGGLIVINRITYLKMLQTSYNMVVVLRNVY